MARENLDNLVKIGKLKAEASTGLEISGLVLSGLATLNALNRKTLNIESRFDLAYNLVQTDDIRQAGRQREFVYMAIAGTEALNSRLPDNCHH